jgi:hypothetical protein
MLSIPRGTDPLIVPRAAREFAKIEFADHRYVMVLHDHQANPHVHLSVKAESKHGQRLSPRKGDLHRWRETFAERLQEWGIDAEATRQATRGEYRNRDALWHIKAKEEGRLQVRRPRVKSGASSRLCREESLDAWKRIAMALANSDSKDDRVLAKQIVEFVKDMPMMRTTAVPQRGVQRVRTELGSVAHRTQTLYVGQHARAHYVMPAFHGDWVDGEATASTARREQADPDSPDCDRGNCRGTRPARDRRLSLST